jgi:hypothetical protein
MCGTILDGPRALALGVYGSTKDHVRLRREICQYMMCDHRYWGRRGNKRPFKEYIEDHLKKDSKFTNFVVFEAAAKFYDVTIILFSCLNEGPYLEKICYALTMDGCKAAPIYLYCDYNFTYSLVYHPRDPSRSNIPYERTLNSILNKKLRKKVKFIKKKNPAKVKNILTSRKVLNTIEEENLSDMDVSSIRHYN